MAHIRFGYQTDALYIYEMIKMTNSFHTIATIMSWITDDKNPCTFTQLINLC
jgi:hypothetical protein